MVKTRSTPAQSDAADDVDPVRPGPSSRRETRHIAGVIYAGIWLVFLAVPTIAIVNSGAAIVWQLLGYAATLAFAVLYIRLAWGWFSGFEEGCIPPARRVWTGVAVLGGLALLSLPAAGAYLSAFTPFLAALVIFTSRPRSGLPSGVLLWLVPSLLAYLLADQSVHWIVTGPGMGVGFIAVIRITEYYDAQDRQRTLRLRQAAERDAIARDVHDVLGHSLTVLSIKAQLAQRLMEVDQLRAKSELDEIESLARESLSQVRSTVSRLRTPELSGELEAARAALSAAGIEAQIRAESEVKDPTGVLAWALREAVTNIVRHAEASRCEIDVGPSWLRVADDGVGLGETAEGNGLHGLRERASSGGARVMLGRAYPELDGTTPERPGTRIEVVLE